MSDNEDISLKTNAYYNRNDQWWRGKSQEVASTAFHFHFEQICISRKEILICDTKLMKMNKIDNKSIVVLKNSTNRTIFGTIFMREISIS